MNNTKIIIIELERLKVDLPMGAYAHAHNAALELAQETISKLDKIESAKPGPSERELQHVGDEIHNAGCAVTHLNEEIGDHLGALAAELWGWDKARPPLEPKPIT